MKKQSNFLPLKITLCKMYLLYNYSIETLVKWEGIEIQRIGIELFLFYLNYELFL